MEAPYQIRRTKPIVGGNMDNDIVNVINVKCMFLTGLDNADSNLFKFMLSIPIGYIMCPIILLGGMLLVYIRYVSFIIEVKIIVAIVGSRTFSPIACLY